MKRLLTLKRSVITGAGVAIIALAVPSVASVAHGASLPADQIVLNGSCLSVDAVLAAAQQAMAAYVPDGPPAGVIINNNWVPASFLAANEGEYAVNKGCPVIDPPTTTATTTPPDPTTTATTTPPDPTTTTTTTPPDPTTTATTTPPDPTTTITPPDPTTTTTTTPPAPHWWRHRHHHHFGN